jgi:hypothetical protein
MAGLEETVIREPGSHSPEEYARRVHRLALAYGALSVGSLTGLGLLIWQAQLYVSLSQRSNVETLTLAFLLVFFGYILVISAGGAIGACRIAYYSLLRRVGQDAQEVERRKTAALGAARGAPTVAALNVVLEHEGRPGVAIELPIGDAAGSIGTLVIDGAAIKDVAAVRGGSNSLLAFFAAQVREVLAARGVEATVQIVNWKKLDDEGTDQYLSLVRFAQNLARTLEADELWPKVTLLDRDCQVLQLRLEKICPALRDEAFLPDWEYEAQHQLPLIPEPLGLVSLNRSEKRADPVATMGCAVLVVLGLVFALAFFIAFPPWVPGA